MDDEKSEGSGTNKKTGRKPFISPTSSFIDFAELESEVYSPTGLAMAHQYNPHAERHIKKPITDFETIVHMMKGSVGAGILAMPKGFYNSGIAVGVIGTFLLGVLCIYGIDTLIRMQYIQCQRLRVPFLALPRSLKIAMVNGPWPLPKLAWLAPWFADIFLVGYQLGICMAYVIFIAESLKSISEPRLFKKMDLRIYMLIIFIPLVLINFIRNLKKLTPVSLTANILIAIALCCCFYVIFFVGPFRTKETNMVSSIKTWPLFIGTVLFALEAVGVIIALEHNMEKPQHFLGWCGIFPWSIMIVVILYTFVGLVGYLKYGPDVKDTIVASLPSDHWMRTVVEAIYAVCIYGSYPLQCFVSLEIIWGNYLRHHIKNPEKECAVEYALRILVVIITFIGAALVPHVDIMISLVGAVCLSTLGIVFPFLIELCTLYPDDLGKCYFTVFKDILFIIIGLGILVVGGYVSIYSLIDK